LTYLITARGRVTAVVSGAMIAAGLVAAGGAQAMAATAGTSIGTAAVLATSVNGSLGSTTQDDWWVIYPAATGGTVKLEISDTTGASAPCTDLSVKIDGADGGNSQLSSPVLGADSSQDESVAQPGSGFYYVEVDTYACGSVTQPVTYSLNVRSGGGGKVPVVAAGKTGAGSSIGHVGAALAGATVYSGTVVTTSNQYWYQLYKPSSPGTGTVRFADTTVAGSAPCSDLDVTLTDSDGNQLDSDPLGDNSAVSYSVSNAGLYYLEVSAYGCGGSDGATYSIEPNPPSAFTGAPAFKTGKTGGASSMKRAGSPLAGDTVYSGTIATTSNQYWYKLYKPSGKGSATVRFADTTVYGGGASCSDIALALDDSHGNQLDSDALGQDTAVSYTVRNAGVYYVEISAYGCGGSDGATYSIEPNPGATWAGTPAITKISPAKGPTRGRTVVKIYGTWLSGASSVLFGKAKGTKLHVVSSTELTVVVPAHAKGKVGVTVTTGAGRSALGKATYYTYS
jgi:hypothetical protein